jgi:hypothetical protein
MKPGITKKKHEQKKRRYVSKPYDTVKSVPKHKNAPVHSVDDTDELTLF